MSGPIKKGDLVMTLACNNPLHNQYAGLFFTVENPSYWRADTWRLEPAIYSLDGDRLCWASCDLKKIDPPATGEYDRVPVRKAQPKKVPA